MSKTPEAFKAVSDRLDLIVSSYFVGMLTWGESIREICRTFDEIAAGSWGIKLTDEDAEKLMRRAFHRLLKR